MKESFKSNKLFITVVTLCDISILDINDYFGLSIVRKKGLA